MKNRDLYEFQRGLNLAKFEHPRCTYAVNKNKRRVTDTIEDMEKDNINQDDDYKAYSKEREELAIKYSEKDESGKPKVKRIPNPLNPDKPQVIYVIKGHEDEQSPYRKALVKLNKKHEKAIEKFNSKIDKYNKEFMDIESDFEPFMLDFEILEAHEKCPQVVMDMIHWMIREPKD